MVCGEYSPIDIPLDVAPLLNGGDILWWFNGATPANYPTKETLTAVPGSETAYDWKITSAKPSTAFKNNKSSVSTTDSTTDIHSTGTSVSKAVNDVSVTVTVNGVASDPFPLTVRAPYKLKFLGNQDKPNAVQAYTSIVTYTILDTLKSPMPADAIPLREEWGAIHDDYPGCDWLRGAAVAVSATGGKLIDNIDGQTADKVFPVAKPPQNPLGNKPAHDWPGEWYVGSYALGEGTPVATLTWQKYSDHARHENVVTPPASK